MSIESQSYSRENLEADIFADTQKELFALKQEIVDNDPEKKVNLKEKPINLGYKEIYKEKKITINLPNEYSAHGRILRCMRWKSMTDAVEDKYDIPRGLLLAMMAQEGMGDPTMPNLGGDGGLGLIHIQGKNADDYGLKTLPRYNEGMRDLQHGEEINNVLEDTQDVKELIAFDDRFHPLMGLDCSARFLKDVYNRTDAGPDRWINALRKYSGRSLEDYLRPVVKYWLLVNEYTGDPLPNFSVSTNKEITKMKDAKQVTIDGINVPLDLVKTSSKKLSITLDGKPATYEQYLSYFNQQAINYGLNDYKKAKVLEKKPETIIEMPSFLTQKEKKTENIFPNIDSVFKSSEKKPETELTFLNKSKDKLWNVYKTTLTKDINFLSDLDYIKEEFPGKKLQFTDITGKELQFNYIVLEKLPLDRLPILKKGDVLYIKEKIE